MLWDFYPCGPDWITERADAEILLHSWRHLIRSSKPGSIQGCTSITDWMTSISAACFSGFEEHTAHDYLFLSAIFPGSPAYFVCTNEAIWERFSSGIATYMARYRTDTYRALCCGTANSLNCWDYNYTAGKNYYCNEVLVFRKGIARVPRDRKQTYFNKFY